jgi:DNA processing protein
MVSLEFLLTLNSLRIGSAFYERLLRHFGSPEAIAEVGPERLLKIPRLSTFAGELPKALKERRGRQELDLTAKHGVEIISFEDDRYPQTLKSVFDYPLVLYIKGNIRALNNNLALAIVGTRHNTIYGQMQAERLAYGLAQKGFCVVSGLARGIDTYAHQGVLKVKGGQTIAVLGNGLKHIYPPENKKLLEWICENGAVVSELPFAMPVNKINFPTRNRIISGLSLGTVVIEAPLRSGALITADFALEQGREVFALPGKVDNPASQGCHKLIKQGAKLIEGIEDILDELNITSPGREALVGARLAQSLSVNEKSLLSILDTSEQLNIDAIIDRVKLPSAMVLTTLLTLEMKKLVRQMPGKSYVRM